MHVKLRKFSKKNLHSWRRLKEKWDHPDHLVFPADQEDKEQQDHLEHLAFLAHQLEND